MAGRMNDDLVFEASNAKSDFGFCPRNFSPTKVDILLVPKNIPF
jgi:hypothetical protein